MDRILDQKIRRIASGEAPRVLDLFSGCGGISLGFHRAGFDILGAVEMDPDAARSHAINFHNSDPSHSGPVDITNTSPLELAETLQIDSAERSIDIITGGPPCQAFARVGRSKLREIDAHPHAFLHDPRAQLFRRYLAYVRAFMPVAVLMENVPDILNHGGHNIAEEVSENLTNLGYVVRYTLINAALYGVPQMRERMFLIAYRKELDVVPKFPVPTHWTELPPGYHGSRTVALKALRGMAVPSRFYSPAPSPAPSLPPSVTVGEAIDDLAEIDPEKLIADGKLGRRKADLSTISRYRLPSPTTYQRLMREWPGFIGDNNGATAHVVRYLPRDYRIFSEMRQGDQYPEACAVAERIFRTELLNLRLRGVSINEGSKGYALLRAQFVPPYDPNKFPNKWRKIWRDKPARTLMAHLGKDSYSHIHYSQGRTISVREAARLQSFPDGFQFSGAMNAAFKQIGNAVPPVLAYELAKSIKESLIEAAARKLEGAAS
ncbi:DNA cytosine methyltransferase [Stenotrophomonas sp. YAU14A_MKIMI4_1]|uniref:DNA cytosine methyltransferase n=1 Tax=Stenotrophomonas sp. YAU14A_MKIMI4_1 TaxID=2072408 RepID=UPI000D53E34A|nr:DNA cytosine methyltransferase [Stenotrophomonas sp. YAU14A_MKIMI4_1]AWH27821.1 DNA cytosine methyltransferase [Stenotrophomonas sp. YAU14A_MKIMI4_1]